VVVKLLEIDYIKSTPMSAFFLSKENKMNNQQSPFNNFNPPKINLRWGALIIPFFLFLLAMRSWTVIDAGYRGVEIRLGKVQGQLEEGFHFIMPFVTRVQKIPVRETKIQNTVQCYSQDAQVVASTFSVNLYPVKTEINQLYQEVGADFITQLAPQIIEASIKQVIGKYKAVDLITNRLKATQEIRMIISDSLKEKRLIVVNFELVNIDFDDAFEKAVKDKVIAVELSKKSLNLLEKAKNDKQIRITEAEAEAESMRIRADALQTNRNLIEYETIQKWNGVLPQYMMGDSVPLLNIKK